MGKGGFIRKRHGLLTEDVGGQLDIVIYKVIHHTRYVHYRITRIIYTPPDKDADGIQTQTHP